MKQWIADWHWGVRIGLFLILLSSLMQFGMFALSQNYMIAYLGAQPEDISFALVITYAGIISILPVQFRFIRYFDIRDYLMVNILLAIGLNYLTMHCMDMHVFFVLRFLQGILVGNTAACVLILIFSRVHSARSQAVGSAVFYGTILSNTVLIGFVASYVVSGENWQRTYYYLMLFQLLTLLIVWAMLLRNYGHKSYPLYQVDWSGFIIFATAAVAFAYTMVYGSKYYWFADKRIRYAVLLTIICLAAFLYRQSLLKRPLIHLDVFKSRNFWLGLCLLAIYYGSKDTINLIYGYSASVLKWDPQQIMTLGLVNITGMVLLLVITTRLIIAKLHSTKAFLITGFLCMVIYHGWMYVILTPDLSFNDLLLPVFLQGAASGLLFVPLILFILSHAPKHTGTTGLVVAAYARFTATLNSVAGYYNLQLYFNQYFKEGFLSYLTGDNQNMATRLSAYKQLYAAKGFIGDQTTALANSAIMQTLNQQSQLLTYRAVFMGVGLLLLFAALLSTCLKSPKV